MSQASAVKVILAAEEDLRLILEPTKGRGVNDAVTIHLERAAILALPWRVISLDALAVEYVVKVVFHSSTLAPPSRVEKRGLQEMERGGGVKILLIMKFCQQFGS